MGFFADLGQKSLAPVKSGADALYNFMAPTPAGALSGPLRQEDRPKSFPYTAAEIKESDKVMPSITETGLMAMQPDYKGDVGALSKVGAMAMEGAPVYTDSSRQAVFTPDKEDKKKFDLESLGEVLKSVKPMPEERMSQVSSGGRVGGGFRFDKSQYENPLLQREFQSLYMAPLYNDLSMRG